MYIFYSLQKVVYAGVLSQFNNCNSLYSGLSHKSNDHLQPIGKAASRLLDRQTDR